MNIIAQNRKSFNFKYVKSAVSRFYEEVFLGIYLHSKA